MPAALDPVPPGALETRLRELREAAVDAQLEAERLEGEARKARRRANQARRRYDILLLEHGGQLTLPFEEGS